jgi:hypothetical protein
VPAAYYLLQSGPQSSAAGHGHEHGHAHEAEKEHAEGADATTQAAVERKSEDQLASSTPPPSEEEEQQKVAEQQRISQGSGEGPPPPSKRAGVPETEREPGSPAVTRHKEAEGPSQKVERGQQEKLMPEKEKQENTTAEPTKAEVRQLFNPVLGVSLLLALSSLSLSLPLTLLSSVAERE